MNEDQRECKAAKTTVHNDSKLNTGDILDCSTLIDHSVSDVIVLSNVKDSKPHLGLNNDSNLLLVDNTRKKTWDDRILTKILIRHLPAEMTEDEFVSLVSPLPELNYFYFVQGSGWNQFSRAYINFVHSTDIYEFTKRISEIVFVDIKGDEYQAVVEYAPFQRVAKCRNNRKKNALCGTLSNDPQYLDFVTQYTAMSEQGNYSEQLNENYFNLIAASDSDEEQVITPLIAYLRGNVTAFGKFKVNRKHERRRKEYECKWIKDDMKRLRKDVKEKLNQHAEMPASNRCTKWKEKPLNIPRTKYGKDYADDKLKNMTRKSKEEFCKMPAVKETVGKVLSSSSSSSEEKEVKVVEKVTSEIILSKEKKFTDVENDDEYEDVEECRETLTADGKPSDTNANKKSNTIKRKSGKSERLYFSSRSKLASVLFIKMKKKQRKIKTATTFSDGIAKEESSSSERDSDDDNTSTETFITTISVVDGNENAMKVANDSQMGSITDLFNTSEDESEKSVNDNNDSKSSCGSENECDNVLANPQKICNDIVEDIVSKSLNCRENSFRVDGTKAPNNAITINRHASTDNNNEDDDPWNIDRMESLTNSSDDETSQKKLELNNDCSEDKDGDIADEKQANNQKPSIYDEVDVEQRKNDQVNSSDGNVNDDDANFKNQSTLSKIEKRIKNKDRPSIEIYRPGMGRYSKVTLQRRKTEAEAE